MENSIDRAQWQRYKVSNKDRCSICSAKAEVTVTLLATVKREGKGGIEYLAKLVTPFCNTHGLLKYGDAKRAIQSSHTEK